MEDLLREEDDGLNLGAPSKMPGPSKKDPKKKDGAKKKKRARSRGRSRTPVSDRQSKSRSPPKRVRRTAQPLRHCGEKVSVSQEEETRVAVLRCTGGVQRLLACHDKCEAGSATPEGGGLVQQPQRG